MENFEAMPPMWTVPKSSRPHERFGERNQYVSFAAGAGAADVEHCTRLMNSTGYITTQLDGLLRLWETKRRAAAKALEEELLQLKRLKELAELQRAELARDTAESWKEKAEKLHKLLVESMNREKRLVSRVQERKSMHASRKATQEVKEHLERVDSFLHFVLRNAPIAIGHQALEGREYRQRFVYNQYPNLQEIFGKTTEEMLGNINRTVKLDEVAVELKKPFTREVTYTSPDPCFGSKTFVAFVEPVTDQTKEVVVAINIIAMDATDQVAKREKLAKLREEAAVQHAIQNELHKTLGITEETTRVKQLLATMSHEIRSPLSGVMGMLDILATTKLDAEQQKLVDVMTNSGEVVLQVINDILDLSKYESGALKLEEKSFQLQDLVKSVLQVAAVSARNKNLSLEGFIAEDVPLEVIGDWLRIRQLLVNLISNAIKFTNEGAVKLRVTASRDVTKDDKPVENGQHQTLWLQFEVSDTGIGIPESDFPYLFNMYMQSTYARENGRTGLGLAICKQLVDKMGGELRVSSIVKKGSSFSFRLPVTSTNLTSRQGVFRFAPYENPKGTQGKQAATAGSLEECMILRRAKILLVDDSSVNITVTQNMLKRLGAKAEIVMTGKDAVEFATRKKYDVILMDICLPVLDGLEATRQIREYERRTSTERTPIIAMTANSAQSYHDMEGCITKPFKLGRLKQTLDSILHA